MERYSPISSRSLWARGVPGLLEGSFRTRLRCAATAVAFGLACIAPWESRTGSSRLTPSQYPTIARRDRRSGPIEVPVRSISLDPLHRCRNLFETNFKRIREARPGGTWREWDRELVTDCHRVSAGAGAMFSVYGRMVWDEPSPTITAQILGFGNGRFGHPEQDEHSR